MERILAFLRDLDGTTAYAPWNETVGSSAGPPFWLNTTLPPIEEIRDKGLNCVGLLNLVSLVAGGPTHENWFEELDARKVLKPFDRTEMGDYPPGTMLLRQYSDDVHDQGHFAIVFEGEEVAHAFARMTPGKTFGELTQSGKQLPSGVVIESVDISDAWFDGGTYTHVCNPGDWIDLADFDDVHPHDLLTR